MFEKLYQSRLLKTTSNKKDRLPRKSFRFEHLEARCLLSASSTNPRDFTKVYTDPSGYSSNRILVTLSKNIAAAPDDCLAATTYAGTPTLGNGKVIGKSTKLMEGIYAVDLAKGISVQYALQKYSGRGYILHAQPDYVIKSTATPKDPLFNQQWGLHNTGQTDGKSGAHIWAGRTWNTSTGSGNMVIAIIDSGVDYTHPDLKDNMWVNTAEIDGNGIDDDKNGYVDDIYGYDFGDQDADPIDDVVGHGTHVAGIAAAQGNNNEGIVGVMWDARIMALKIGATGFQQLEGFISAGIQAIDYAINNGAKVINASWGYFGPQHGSLFTAIDRARSAGVIFVAAAGNSGLNHDKAFGNPSSIKLDNVISVAASDHFDILANFSDYGPNTVHLAAPGVNILSTTPVDGMGNATYGFSSGTSMAAPHVAGAIALLWDKFPNLSYRRVIQLVLENVDKLPSLRSSVITGGRLNIYKAFVAAAGGTDGNTITLPGTTSMQAANNTKVVTKPAASVSSRINVAGNFTISDVDVIISIDHPKVSRLRITLFGPDNKVYANLVHRAGGNGTKFSSTLFDDSAKTSIQKGKAPFTGSFKPNASLDVFKGTNARGTWKLVVRDYETGRTGVINGWRLVIKGYPGAPGSYVSPPNVKPLASTAGFNSVTAPVSTMAGPSGDKVLDQGQAAASTRASSASASQQAAALDYVFADQYRSLVAEKLRGTAAYDPQLLDEVLAALGLLGY